MLEDELLARDRWSREDLLAYERGRARALVDHAVIRVVQGEPVSSLPPEPGGKLRLVRSA
jgi:hypothetical protein